MKLPLLRVESLLVAILSVQPHALTEAPATNSLAIASQAEKLTVPCPPILNEKKVIQGLSPKYEARGGQVVAVPEKKPIARYSFSESADELEGTRTRTLSISERFDVNAKLQIDSTKWQLQCVIIGDKIQVSIRHSTLATSPESSLGLIDPAKKENFELLYRASGEVQRIPCAEAVSALGDSLAKFDQLLRFQVLPVQVLEAADSGMIRIKYPEGQRELALDDDDREAFRWFVWEKVPGGQDLMKARYVLSPRKAEPTPADR